MKIDVHDLINRCGGTGGTEDTKKLVVGKWKMVKKIER